MQDLSSTGASKAQRRGKGWVVSVGCRLEKEDRRGGEVDCPGGWEDGDWEELVGASPRDPGQGEAVGDVPAPEEGCVL